MHAPMLVEIAVRVFGDYFALRPANALAEIVAHGVLLLPARDARPEEILDETWYRFFFEISFCWGVRDIEILNHNT
jgi:hypothetical protein